jgi:hypothetical protein
MSSLSKKAYARRSLILKWRRFLGLCVGCGAEAYGNSKCVRCQIISTERTRARRKAAKESNLCQECGKNKANSGGYRCDACIKLMRLRKDPVKCHTDGCDNEPAYNQHYCKDCLELREAANHVCKVYFIECPDCNQLFTAKTRGAKICDYCRVIRQRVSNRVSNRDRQRKIKGLKLLTKTCAYYRCNNTFQTYNSTKTTCSESCSKKMMKRNDNQRERIRKHPKRLGDRYIEKVDLKVLFYRDGGRCQICGRKLNLTRSNNHPMQSTIDHIIPLDQQGEHSYKNTQLACRQCNSIKSNGHAPGGDQMRLFG